jgi:hypothetical protein
VVPLFGGKMDPKQVLIALSNGEQRLIPLEWTDQTSHPEYSPGVLFEPDRLLVLRQRVDQLLAKKHERAILVATDTEPNPSGGSHAESHSELMGTVNTRTARPDHCHFSPDAITPGQTTRGGNS